MNLPPEMPSPPRFAPEVEAVLREAGWHPERRVAEEVMETWYAFKWENAPGYCRMFPAAYQFLSEFGGLALPRHAARNLHFKEVTLLDPLDAIGQQDDAWFFCEWILETSLFPLGNASDGYGTLIIDLQGRVWGFWEDLILIGETGDEAIINLIMDKYLDLRVNWGEYPEGLKIADRVEKAVARLYEPPKFPLALRS